MHAFASGLKRNYYGKAEVSVYRLSRDGRAPQGSYPVFGASVLMLLYGDAFWPTYTTGDNRSLIATDSMKNFIQRETLNFTGADLESYCHFLAENFMATYPQTEGIQVSAEEIPYASVAGSSISFAPGGPDRATAQLELARDGMMWVSSGIRGYRLLRLGGSAFHGFVRDQYTTLPDIHNRPLHMWLDLEWTYTLPGAAFSSGSVTGSVRNLVYEVFRGFESGSIQQVIYQLGTRVLEQIPEIAEVSLEADNRTWDAVAERDGSLGVYTEPRPPFGLLGLTLRR